jgi:hypothetical protein
MKPLRTLKASILPTVLVVGTLLLLAVFALLSLLDIETTLWFGNRSRQQKEAWLESAFLLWERDSTLSGRLDESGTFPLFEEDEHSQVTISSRYWGLYEWVTASTDGGRVRRTRLMGRPAESSRGAVLYTPDNRRALTVSGKGDIRGTVYLPENGLLYGQVQSDFYQGHPLDESLIRRSAERLPSGSPQLRDSIAALRRTPPTETYSGGAVRRSFFEPTLFLACGDLSGAELRGNIVAVSQNPVTADSTARLEDILIVAPAVTFAAGFSGTVQAIAADSVVVEARARLNYPSGIALPDADPKAMIRIESGAQVNGYVVFRLSGEILPGALGAHVRQHETATTRGLMWVDGIAEIHGTVSGSLYVNQANYYTPQGYYNNLLHNTRLYANRAMAYPPWMENHYRKKTIKWLY